MIDKEVSGYLLYDEIGKVLLMHRDDEDRWGFFGGKVEEGETPIVALRREAEEELGIELPKMELFHVYEQEDGRGRQKRNIFIGPLEHSVESLRKKQKEGRDLDLFTLDEVIELKMLDNDREVLKEVFDSLNK